MEDKIDRFGICPNCGTNWKGEDILDSISKISCNSHKTEKELRDLAANFGYTEHNKTLFSNTISHEIGGKILLECPKLSCGHVFNRYTGEEYKSMFDAHRGFVVAKNLVPMIEDENENDLF